MDLHRASIEWERRTNKLGAIDLATVAQLKTLLAMGFSPFSAVSELLARV